jgi:hypothetical protein
MPEINKVIYGSNTLVDLTDADAEAGDIVSGKKAYLASGVRATGTLDSKQASSGGTDLSLVTTGEKYNWNGKYVKPSGGIPASDLSSAVQTSLGKADTALQSYPQVVSQTISIGDLASGAASDQTYNITAVPSGHQAIGICGWVISGSGTTGTILSRLAVTTDHTKIGLKYRATIAATDVSVTVYILYI